MYRIDPDGTVTKIENGTFKIAKDIIGGYVETVSCIDGSLMLIDEDGKIKDLPANPRATGLVILFPNDFIAGTVIVVEENEINDVMGIEN